MNSVSSFLKLSPQEIVLEDWEVLDDRANVTLGEMLGILIGLCFFVIPGLVMIWDVLTRPRITGRLCLTNWRLVYYSTGQKAFRSMHYMAAANLRDVLGVHSDYREGLFGVKTMTINIHTRFRNGIAIQVGEGNSLLAKLPVLGLLLRRDTLGKDIFAITPVLFTRIQKCQADKSSSKLSF